MFVMFSCFCCVCCFLRVGVVVLLDSIYSQNMSDALENKEDNKDSNLL